MKNWIIRFAACGLLLPVLAVWGVHAQTPTPTSNLPPHIAVEKVVDTTGEVCPGFTIDVSITLTGSGTAIRQPVDAVVIIDKSGSMTWGSQCGWNDAIEPPYGPVGQPPWTVTTRHHAFVDAVWAAWKFFDYFVYHPPTNGYEDYGGLIFYSNTSTIPGVHPVPTAGIAGLPEPIQRVQGDPGNAVHKQFWWFNHLAVETAGGGTATGPAMTYGRNMLAAMPTHPAPPTFLPGTPTPAEPYPPLRGTRYMVVMTDGRPNQSTSSGGELPAWNGSYDQCIEMARRLSLSAPWGAYTGYDTKIYSLGLGAGVDHGLMRQIADPWQPQYLYGTPTPSVAIHGSYHWARTEDDLIDVFEDIADDITSNRAGSDIMVTELFSVSAGPGGYCPDGMTRVYTEIKDGSWNMQPTVLPTTAPSSPPEYIWSFGEMRIGDIIELTFQLEITSDAPTDTTLPYIECPESGITYTDFQGTPVADPIIDPGIYIWPCGGPTRTPTPPATPTETPTCLPTLLFSDGFEDGTFGNWESSMPDYSLSVRFSQAYAHSGNYFAYFAGSEELVPPTPQGPHEARLTKVISLNNPIRQGAALECYARLDNFTFPQKADGSRDSAYDVLTVEIDGDSGQIVEEYTFHDMEDDYINIRIPLNDLAGDDTVIITFSTYFPYTVYQPPINDPNEPKVFLDDVRIVDYCYDDLPTVTPTSPPPPLVPASTPGSLIIMLFILSILILAGIVRRGFNRG